MKRSRWVGVVLLLVLIPSSLIYIWAIQTDYYGLPFSINPKPSEQVIPIVLEYPYSGFSGSGPKIGSFLVWLVSNGTIAQGTEVVSVSKDSTRESPPKWSGAIVTFDEAFAYPPNTSTQFLTTGLPIASFGDTFTNPHLGGNFTFYWPTAGEFSPTLTLTFPNRTVVVYTYSDIKVPVASTTDIQNAKNGRIQTVLTYAILAFAYLEGISITVELTRENDPFSGHHPTAESSPST